MTPWVSANGWAKFRSREFHNGFWLAMRPALQARAQALAGPLETLVENLLIQYDDAYVAQGDEDIQDLVEDFTLTMQLNNHDALYIHVGPFTPDSTRRFSISKLRNAVGGVKPWGVASGTAETWQNGVLSAEQEEVLQEAMDFMEEVAMTLQDEEGHDVGPIHGMGFGGMGMGGMGMGMGMGVHLPPDLMILAGGEDDDNGSVDGEGADGWLGMGAGEEQGGGDIAM